MPCVPILYTGVIVFMIAIARSDVVVTTTIAGYYNHKAWSEKTEKQIYNLILTICR